MICWAVEGVRMLGDVEVDHAKEAQDHGEHGGMMHDAGRRSLCPLTWKITDGDSWLRTCTGRRTATCGRTTWKAFLVYLRTC
jgi:hypothetical protein